MRFLYFWNYFRAKANVGLFVLFALLFIQSGDAQGRLTVNGRQLFMAGMNVAWVNFSSDLGPQPADTAQFRTIFRTLAASGGNVMRFWLHTSGAYTPDFNSSGFVTGPGSASIQNLKNILAIAHEYNIVLQLCLWSHDMLNQSELDTAKLHRNAKLITDTAHTNAYIRNALVPMVQALKGNPAILGWEIFNEPEGITNEFGWAGRDHVPMASIQQAVNLMTGAIHRTDPNAIVTSGANSVQTLTDVNPVSKAAEKAAYDLLSETQKTEAANNFNLGHRTSFTTDAYGAYVAKLADLPNSNYYRDDRLVAVGGDTAGKLDYYNVHFYGTQQQSPFNNPYSHWALNKQLIVGEFYNQDTYGVPWQNLYEDLYNNGYAGGYSWSWTDNHLDVQQSHTLTDLAELFGKHRYDLLTVIKTGTIYKYNTSASTIEVGDTATLSWDVEPGATIMLNNKTINALDSLKVTPTTTTAYVLSTIGQNSTSDTITITVLPTGRIISYQALPTQIGVGETTSLMWNVVKNSKVTLNGKSVAAVDSITVSPDSTNHSYILIAEGTERDSAKITISIGVPANVNRALNAPATASSNDTVANAYSKVKFVDDGNMYTVWQSTASDAQWVQIDLGKPIIIDHMVINWGNQGYAVQYKIETTNDLVSWQSPYISFSGSGGTNNVETISNIQTAGRYVYLQLQKRIGNAYIIKDIQVYGVPVATGINATKAEAAKSFSLNQNYPNPFNPSTVISYSVGASAKVLLKVYDVMGREVRTLVNENQSAGIHSVEFNCSNLPSGIYFYTLRVGNFVQTKKMALIR